MRRHLSPALPRSRPARATATQPPRWWTTRCRPWLWFTTSSALRPPVLQARGSRCGGRAARTPHPRARLSRGQGVLPGVPRRAQDPRVHGQGYGATRVVTAQIADLRAQIHHHPITDQPSSSYSCFLIYYLLSSVILLYRAARRVRVLVHVRSGATQRQRHAARQRARGGRQRRVAVAGAEHERPQLLQHLRHRERRHEPRAMRRRRRRRRPASPLELT